MEDANKAIYATHHDAIIAKRFESPSPIRRHAHRAQYNVFLDLVPPGSTVIDAGCGEGVLSVLLAQHECTVTGVDLSAPNIEAAINYAREAGVGERVRFVVGDAEHLPDADRSFDYAVSSHVLEHLPDFDQGARELARVARRRVIIAIPTCLNPSAWTLLGGDAYWRFSRRTPYAIFLGFARVVAALIRGDEGVNEGYAGRKELIHIYRFPWRAKKRLERAGLRVLSFRASSLPLPYFSFLLPLTRFCERFAHWPILRHLGYGTTYVCEPSGESPD